jgi:hypothetical protein
MKLFLFDSYMHHFLFCFLSASDASYDNYENGDIITADYN